MKSGWIGVDLDGTLAMYGEWNGGIGEPIGPMVERVKQWLKEGRTVKIVTARVAATQSVSAEGNLDNTEFAEEQRVAIKKWSKTHIGQELEVTASKDFAMISLWDDRAVQVEMNTGKVIGREIL